ncbi:MAG: GTP-binding protein [Thermoplasmata archaeon]|nr:GTP-binding protein [Thermoplasmata archaeon]
MDPIESKIKEIEEEILKTQKNKATEHHIGKLKAKLAKLREELREKKSGGGGGKGFSVKKTGDATVGMIGFPSVGKSTLLNLLTNAESRVGEYDFTTIEVIPGMMEYRGARIQILDLPGLIAGASQGKGRGREILSAVRTVDLLMVVVDAIDAENQLDVIERELYNIGVRCNQHKPDVQVKRKGEGGIRVFKTVELPGLSDKTIKAVASEYVVNADIIIREVIDEEQLIDVFMGNRVYVPGFVVINKIDLVGERVLAEVKRKITSRGWMPVAVSALKEEGVNEVRKAILSHLKLIRVYLKPQGGEPDYSQPMILRKGDVVAVVCRRLHRDFEKRFRYALVWGDSVKYPGQKVGLDHVLFEEDVVTIVIER